MGISIEAKFDKAAFQKRLEAFYEAAEQALLDTLRRMGEECITHAKNVNPPEGFTDRTANLRSSMGYALFYDGELIEHTYAPLTSRTTGEVGAKGAADGLALAKRQGAGTKGYALVLTAGMWYAVCVEARGRDVLASAEQMAKNELPARMADLKDDIARAWSEAMAEYAKS